MATLSIEDTVRNATRKFCKQSKVKSQQPKPQNQV